MKKSTLIIAIIGICSTLYAQTTRYVKPTATGTGDGSSWANASGDLQEMINVSSSGDNIFVTNGTYIPNRRSDNVSLITPSDRENAFVLKTGVALYGGFDPTNGIDDLTDTRISGSGGSILSGDFNSNDVITGNGSTLSITGNTENAYHVIVAIATSAEILNGFSVVRGNANGASSSTVNGGLNMQGLGAGINIRNASPEITNCIFKENNGIVMNIQNGTNFITNCSFSQNGGSIIAGSSSPTFRNCIFYGNRQGSGSVLSMGTGQHIFTNCIIFNNQLGSGNALATAGTMRIRNCIVWGNTPSNQPVVGSQGVLMEINNSIIQGGFVGTGNLNTDPIFTNPADADGLDNTFGTADDGLMQASCSPARNAGDNTFISGLTTDIVGATRVLNTTVDMGAYEVPTSPSIRYVKPVATGTGDGTSWPNASGDLQAMINASSSACGDTVLLAVGTYKPNRRADNVTIVTPNDRDNAFVLKNNIKIYGGFDPTNGIDDLADNRIFGSNGTILSGDFSGNDVITGFGSTLSITNITENAYHVIISAGAAQAGLLNGLTVTGGNANGSGTVSVNGSNINRFTAGGIMIWLSVPTIDRCFFVGNSSNSASAVVYIQQSGPIFTNCAFYRNNSAITTFTSSFGQYQMSNTVFWGNKSATTILGVSGGGSLPVITNCAFTGNAAPSLITNNAAVTLSMRNSVLWNNTISGNVIYNPSSPVAIVTNSIVQGGYAGAGNQNIDPKFINQSDPDGADNIFGTADDGIRLNACSQAINRGNNSFVGSIPQDIAGNSRISDGTVDLGPHEFVGAPLWNTGIHTISACSPFTWNGNSYTANNNTATDTLTNINGCDSIVTLNLTILPDPAAPSANPTAIQINPGQYVLFTGSGSGGSLNWYELSTLLATGNSFMSPVITSPTAYMVKEYDGACEGAGTPLSVTLKPVTTFGGRKGN